MKITFWGVRGSIPAPGPQTMKYGGNTTCVELRMSDGKLIIFDAGTGIRPLGLKLMKEMKRRKSMRIHLLLTHGHMDHVQGFPFFAPAYISANRFTVIGCPQPGRKVSDMLSRQMGDLFFPVEYNGLPAQFEYREYCGDGKENIKVGRARIYSRRLNHPGGASSYKIKEKGKTFVFMTDNELMWESPNAFPVEDFVEFVRGADVLVHDTQYTPREYASHTKGWGHSRYTDTALLAVEAGVKKVVLFHHEPEHNDRKIDWIEQKTKEEIKRLGGRCACVAAREGMTLNL